MRRAFRANVSLKTFQNMGASRERTLACVWIALSLVGPVVGQGTGTTGTGTTGTDGTATGATGTAGATGATAAALDVGPLLKISPAACVERGPDYIFNVPSLSCARCPAGQVPNAEGNECVCPSTSRSAGMAGPLVCIDCSSQDLSVSLDGMSCMACSAPDQVRRLRESAPRLVLAVDDVSWHSPAAAPRSRQPCWRCHYAFSHACVCVHGSLFLGVTHAG